jgi:hypothetical protein
MAVVDRFDAMSIAAHGTRSPVASAMRGPPSGDQTSGDVAEPGVACGTKR